jgi:hypothetical protein
MKKIVQGKLNGKDDDSYFVHVTHIAQHLNVAIFHLHNAQTIFPTHIQLQKLMYCLYFLHILVIHHMIQVVICHPRLSTTLIVFVWKFQIL